MSGSIARVFVFLLFVLGVYLWIGYSVTALTGGRGPATTELEISPEGGEAIYWGKGRCYTCHSVGGQGSAVRGPNHGQFGERFPLGMGARAVERAAERSAKEGVDYTAVDYIVESLASPGAYVVEGYKNEMAVVYAPPISLSLDEIKAVVSYLMTLGGDLDMEAIDTAPDELTTSFYSKISAAAEAGGGDPAEGAIVYEDNCMECHRIGDDDGGEIGPEISGIAAKGLSFISDSVLQPTKAFSPGYETYVAINQEGRQFKGIMTRDADGEIDLTNALGDVETLQRADLKELRIDETESIMPGDIAEILTVKEFQDMLSYLMLQKPAREN